MNIWEGKVQERAQHAATPSAVLYVLPSVMVEYLDNLTLAILGVGGGGNSRWKDTAESFCEASGQQGVGLVSLHLSCNISRHHSHQLNWLCTAFVLSFE